MPKPIAVTEAQLIELRHTLAARLTAETGEKWVYANENVDNNWQRELISGPKGAFISVCTAGGDASRIALCGYSENYANTPRFAVNDKIMPTITIAFDRGVDVVVRDVKRRLLPEVFEIIELANKYAEERKINSDKVRSLADRIEKALGSHFKRSKANSDTGPITDVYIHAGTVDKLSTTVQVSGTSVSIELKYLSPKYALPIIELIAKLAQQ